MRIAKESRIDGFGSELRTPAEGTKRGRRRERMVTKQYDDIDEIWKDVCIGARIDTMRRDIFTDKVLSLHL